MYFKIYTENYYGFLCINVCNLKRRNEVETLIDYLEIAFSNKGEEIDTMWGNKVTKRNTYLKTQ